MKPAQPSVLVTGTSSGIGRATALRLDRAGYRVFAGVRKASDGEALAHESQGRVQPLILDVADPASLKGAVQQLTQSLGAGGLDALVNNAGIGTSGPLEFQPLEEMEKVFQINVFGLVALTQAMLPLLRLARGRIVNTGSIGDRFTVPFGAVLCASKSAVRSITEALRLELHPFGIHVCLIEPASVSTPAVEKFAEEARQRIAEMSPEASRLYAAAYGSFLQRAVSRERFGSPPEVVAEVILEALTSAKPGTRYRVAKGSTLLALLPALLPDRLLDGLRRLVFGLPQTFGGH